MAHDAFPCNRVKDLTDIDTRLQPLQDAEGALGLARIDPGLGRAVHEFCREIVPGECARRMARRPGNPHGRTLPVRAHRFDLHDSAAPGAARFEQGVIPGAAGIFRDAEAWVQGVDLRPVHDLVGERPEGVLPIEDAGGEGVLQTKLALQPGLGVGVGQHAHAPGWHPTDEMLQGVRREAEPVPELEYAIHAPMGGVAAGETFQRQPRSTST